MTASARDWAPAASINALRQRAGVLRQIRQFFDQREVMEVTTPALSAAAACDPQIESFRLDAADLWLQSSPEFHMKRLLAAGSGAIYQLAPAFRQEEQGRWHNPEFSMLEWYRPGFDQHDLMDEVAALWRVLADRSVELPRWPYVELIQQHLGLDWADCSAARLRQALQDKLGPLPSELDRTGLLDAAMGLLIGPQLGQDTPCFVHDFPPEQAALARLRQDENGQRWACRFELYWQGQELANGFYELSDAAEQRRRFEQDLALRNARGQVTPPMDEALLSALDHGLPDCAGVALGVDRLCALVGDASELSAVMAFPIDRA